MRPTMFGEPPAQRVEDEAFVRGKANYLDDLMLPEMAFAVFVRSTEAHAALANIETADATSLPGVIGIFTSADAEADGLKPLRPTLEANPHTGVRFSFAPQPLLATGHVRYVGEPIALIVAETLSQAMDAAEHVETTYEYLDAVCDARRAIASDAPVVSSDMSSNVCFDFMLGDHDAVEQALADAFAVAELNVTNHRIVTNPMEPRGIIGVFDPDTGRFTAHVSSQKLHTIRDSVANTLGVSVDHVRFTAPEVGGNFGAKNFVYPEYALMLWSARKVGRPVKWMATRSEIFLADHQARDHHASAKLALDETGRFLALKVESVANAGAYLVSTGGVQSGQYAHLPGTVYDIPAIGLHIRGAITNTAPVGVTRGPGFAEAVNVMERLIDAAARQFNFDRADLRRKNMFRASRMPIRNAFGQVVDSGHFVETFDIALDEANVAGFPDRRRQSLEADRLRGLGYAYHIKGTGGDPTENVEISFVPDRSVILKTGTHSTGQGHATTFPQIVGGLLGIDPEGIQLMQADTDLLPLGGGSASSRSTYMAGSAMWHACQSVITQGQSIAADMLDVALDQIDFTDGLFVAKGTNKTAAIYDVAAQAHARGAPLKAYAAWTREAMTFPNGAHVVEVELDRQTGEVSIVRYTAVDDYGHVVNPTVIEGQIHGAIAQGIGQAVTERTIYDEETGQLLSGSFMDYAMPRADDIPPFVLGFHGTACTTNPLGVKGSGEAGAIAAYPAIHNAVQDALSAIGSAEIDAPITPEKIWHILKDIDGADSRNTGDI
ncbi:MAG: xanthine dehydrogenase family protein molybdopterin-binding subunit [Pseudomonadota bacterium]